jgi:laminin alpha 3/5
MGTNFVGGTRLVLGYLAYYLMMCTLQVEGAVLTPPYFNIAERRRIEATHTCGEGVERPELYCKLVGANQDSTNHDNILIQGQVRAVFYLSSILKQILQ